VGNNLGLLHFSLVPNQYIKFCITFAIHFDNKQYITLLFDHFHQIVYHNKCTSSSYASTRTKKRIDKVYMNVINFPVESSLGYSKKYCQEVCIQEDFDTFWHTKISLLIYLNTHNQIIRVQIYHIHTCIPGIGLELACNGGSCGGEYH